jgi:predicted permease
MRWYYRLPLRLRSLFRKDEAEADLSEELQFHLQNQIDEYLAQGMGPQEARQVAFRSLGGIEQVKEECREARKMNLIESFLQDARFGSRMLRRSLGFTAVAVLTLALGIGATTSIFSVVKAVILNPLPFRQPEQLVDVWENDHVQHYRRGDQAYFSSVRTGVFYEWRAQCQSFESLSAYRWRYMLLGGERGAELVEGQDVMDQFFETLGVPAQLGRTFEPADYAPNAPHTTILSHRVWVERFVKDPGIIGRRISLDRESFEIVGVMPEGFFPTPWHYPELWTPHWADAKEKQDRNAWGHFVIARLKPEVSWEQAQTELDVASVRIAKNHPGEQEVDATIVPMDSELIGSSWKLLLLLAGGVVLLLLIACVNVSNLLLARVTDRQKEFSVRAALGAGRWRLISQLFIESCVLSLVAGLAGIAVASAGTHGLLRLLPTSANLPRLDTVKTDAGVLAFGFGLALLVTLLSSLAPFLRVSRNKTTEVLKSEGRGSSSGRTRRRVGEFFVVSEFVLSLVLLILGTLLVQSFLKLLRADPGFDTSNLLAFHITVPQVSYGTFAYGEKDMRRQRLYEQLEQTLSAVPDVDSLAFAGHLPLAHEFNPSPVHVEGHTPLPGRPGADGATATGSEGDTGIQYVNPEYFHALRLRLTSGRFLAERDTVDKPLAAVINETFARTFFPNEDPIGKRVTVWFAKPMIVGVVADFKLNSIDRKPLPEIFWSLRQVAPPNIWVMVRSGSNPSFLSGALRQKVRDLDSDLPVQDVQPMSGVIADSLWLKRTSALLIGLVAALAIILAGTGIYSVMSYCVSQRTREVGIRVALGASRNEILSLLVGETCRLAFLGSVIGCAAAYFVGRVATNQAYLSPEFASSQIPSGPLSTGVFLVCSLFLFGVALSASYVPARHALCVDPMQALRHE